MLNQVNNDYYSQFIETARAKRVDNPARLEKPNPQTS